MDESVSQVAEKPPAAPSYSTVMARALVSAVVFGMIGGWVGKWLGARGNAAGNNMAQPIMKYGMAGFWALVAAHSSLKASEHAANVARGSTVDMYHDADPKLLVALESDTHAPLLSVDAASVQHGGELAQTHEKSRG